jgi:hypothetical protein
VDEIEKEVRKLAAEMEGQRAPSPAGHLKATIKD